MSRVKQAVGLVVFIAVCFGAAAAGGAATYPRIEGWYAALTKPSWTPPDWLFGPVWVAIAATLVAFWRQSVAAGLLFVPYLAWVTFAAALNYSIWQMNA